MARTLRAFCPILLAVAGNAAAQAPRPDPVFAHQFEDGVATLVPNLTYVPLGATIATTAPTPLTLTLTSDVMVDTFVPLTSSDAMRVSIAGGGVTVPAGQSSAPVFVTATVSEVATPVTISANLGNRVAAGVRVESALNETGSAAEADFCKLQFPSGFAVTGGQETLTLFGRFFEMGVTETAGAPMGWIAQVGYGPFGSDPRALTAWYFFDATFNTQVGNDDEFQASFVAPRVAGNYSTVFRFSGTNGATWTYCDDGSSSDGGAGSNPGLTFDLVNMGAMVVSSPFTGFVINEIDYDQPNMDTTEFVEIYNGSFNNVDLTGLSLVLVNGGTTPGVEYRRVDLGPGTLASGQYLLVASPGVTAPMGVRRVDIPPEVVQNGSPDGVALVDTASTRIVDALAYEGAITAATILGFMSNVSLVEGTALSTMVFDDAMVTAALIRSPNGADTNNANDDWVRTATPTPGAANVAN